MNGNQLKPLLKCVLVLSIYLVVLQYEERLSWFLLPVLSFDSYLLRLAKMHRILPEIGFIVSVSMLQISGRAEKKYSKTGLHVAIAAVLPLCFLFLKGPYLHPGVFACSQPLCLVLIPTLLSRIRLAGTESPAFGIANPTRKVLNSSSFNWRTDKGYINITNPFQGILIVGGAGSGKTYSLIEEIISQSLRKGYSGLVYDFKYPELSNYVYHSAAEASSAVNLFHVNFSDMERTHRINPLHPRNLPVSAFANEYAGIILKNLKKEWVSHQDFWADNAIAYFKAIIWYLKKHFPAFCTLPHAVSMGLSEYPLVLELLSQDKDCKSMISSLLTAYREDASAQIAGCVSSLQTPLDRLNIPALFWVLTGNDCDLDLNDPERPCMLTIGNNAVLSETLNPVISLISSVIMRKLNQKNRCKSIFLLDEAPTLYIPNLRDLPNTGRSNQVVTVYCCQDYSQMDLMYGAEEARTLRASLGNQFIGMVNDISTAEQVSRIFGKMHKRLESTNKSTSLAENGDRNYSSGSSFQIVEKNLVEPDQVMTLATGTFLGKTTETKKPFFFARPLLKKKKTGNGIPAFKDFNFMEPPLSIERCIELNYKKIQMETELVLTGDQTRP